MVMESIVKPVVSQAVTHQGINSNTSLGLSSSPQDFAKDTHWFNQILGGIFPESVKSVLPGITNAFEKAGVDFKALDRKSLALAKNPSPVGMLSQSYTVFSTMSRLAIVTKLASQGVRALDKLTSIN